MQQLRLNLKKWKILLPQKQRIKLLPSEDRATLAVCIGIALFFWLLVKLSRTYTTEKKVHFRYELPSGKTFKNNPPATISVQLQGRGWELMFDYLYDPEILVTYNLERLNRDELSIEQLRYDIDRKLAFNSLQVIRIDNAITLQVEEGATKKIPITPNDSITFSAGYHLLQPLQIKPDSVILQGPASLVSKVQNWETTPFLLANLKTSVSKTIPLKQAPPEFDLNVQAVQAIVEVEQVTEKSMFVKLTVKNPPSDSIKFFPETVKITCTIGLSRYNKIDTSDFLVEIDLSKVSLKEGKHTVPIQLARQPLDALHVQFTPKSAEFFIFKR